MEELNEQHWLSKDTELNSNIILRPFCLKELCQMYNVTYKTIHKWLSPFKHLLGERNGYLYNIHQVRLIFLKLGPPGISLNDSF